MSVVAHRNRVLVADDEEVFRRTTVEILRREGYEAEGVSDGLEGLQALLEKPFDLVVADLRMSGNEDFAFVRNVSDKCSVPMLIVTGYPSIDTAVSSVRHAVVDYLIKPVQPQEFLRRVNVALSKNLRGVKADVETRRQMTNNSSKSMTLDQILSCQISEIYRALKALEISINANSSEIKETPLDLCQFMKCTNLEEHRAMLRESVNVLAQTKHSFHSKELASLRIRIEKFLEGSK
jgi:DNA-binding NtrC family response regulator